MADHYSLSDDHQKQWPEGPDSSATGFSLDTPNPAEQAESPPSFVQAMAAEMMPTDDNDDDSFQQLQQQQPSTSKAIPVQIQKRSAAVKSRRIATGKVAVMKKKGKTLMSQQEKERKRKESKGRRATTMSDRNNIDIDQLYTEAMAAIGAQAPDRTSAVHDRLLQCVLLTVGSPYEAGKPDALCRQQVANFASSSANNAAAAIHDAKKNCLGKAIKELLKKVREVSSENAANFVALLNLDQQQLQQQPHILVKFQDNRVFFDERNKNKKEKMNWHGQKQTWPLVTFLFPLVMKGLTRPTVAMADAHEKAERERLTAQRLYCISPDPGHHRLTEKGAISPVVAGHHGQFQSTSNEAAAAAAIVSNDIPHGNIIVNNAINSADHQQQQQQQQQITIATLITQLHREQEEKRSLQQANQQLENRVALLEAGQQHRQNRQFVIEWEPPSASSSSFEWLMPLGLHIKFPSLDKIELIMQRFVDQYVVTRSREIHGPNHRRRNNNNNANVCGQCLDSIAGERRLVVARHGQLDESARKLLHDFMLLASLLCTGETGQMFGEYNLKRMFVFFMQQKVVKTSYERRCACGYLDVREGEELVAENVVHSISNHLCAIGFTPPIDPSTYSCAQVCPYGRVKCLNLLRDFVFRNHMNMHHSQGEQMERLCREAFGGLVPYAGAYCSCGYFENNLTPAGAAHAFSNWMIVNGYLYPTHTGAPTCSAGRLLEVKDILKHIETSDQFVEIFNPEDSDACFVYCQSLEDKWRDTVYFGFPHAPIIAGSSVFLCFKHRRYFRPVNMHPSCWLMAKAKWHHLNTLSSLNQPQHQQQMNLIGTEGGGTAGYCFSTFPSNASTLDFSSSSSSSSSRAALYQQQQRQMPVPFMTQQQQPAVLGGYITDETAPTMLPFTAAFPSSSIGLERHHSNSQQQSLLLPSINVNGDIGTSAVVGNVQLPQQQSFPYVQAYGQQQAINDASGSSSSSGSSQQQQMPSSSSSFVPTSSPLLASVSSQPICYSWGPPTPTEIWLATMPPAPSLILDDDGDGGGCVAGTAPTAVTTTPMLQLPASNNNAASSSSLVGDEHYSRLQQPQPQHLCSPVINTGSAAEGNVQQQQQLQQHQSMQQQQFAFADGTLPQGQQQQMMELYNSPPHYSGQQWPPPVCLMESTMANKQSAMTNKPIVP